MQGRGLKQVRAIESGDVKRRPSCRGVD
jgi:hypothetical protein